MAPPTPYSSSSGKLHSKDHYHQQQQKNPTTPAKTTIKHRLNFSGLRTPNPSSINNVPTEHPVEVIGRIRNHPDRKETTTSALDIADDGRSVRVKTDIGYRDFGLDGISTSEEEDLDGFYKKFVESRIRGVKLGAKCTIMMYGPTGSGKSHTMFGCPKQPGIVYRALKDILGVDEDAVVVDNAGFGAGLFVQVAVLEIYNEEIYDLLSGLNAGGGTATGLQKPNAPKVRLEVMGKKAKNASYITGNEAGKISREVAKVEKRRIVKSTLCNERSSRSHCLIILDVPSVGGRLMLVDMAGSENFDQAGQTGFEAKMQTSKINQGNTTLKRVVESIANGDSHVPFRDSKLTMLLQDSFEDDRTKILMILCASPDPKEMHKTISTLEYGAKAKCIIRVAHMPTPTPKDKMSSDGSSAVILGSRIAAMNHFIYKLQMENKQREKERDEAQKKLLQKEAELTGLRDRLKTMEGKVDERTFELERMREKMGEQQKELEALRHTDFVAEMGGSRFLQRLSEACNEGMEKSMELDMGDIPTIHDVKEVENGSSTCPPALSGDGNRILPRFPGNVCLSTVFEGNEEEEDDVVEVVVEKEVIEENKSQQNFDFLNLLKEELNHKGHELDSTASRSTRIQNIFRLCGNYREIAHAQQVVKSKTPTKKTTAGSDQPLSPLLAAANDHFKNLSHDGPEFNKENSKPKDANEEGLVDVCVKWETSKELSGNLIKKFKVLKNASLSDIRKLIENEENNREQQPFIFLLLGEDPTGAPVSKDKEGMIPVSKLPADCSNNQLSGGGLLACLRPVKRNIDDFLPLSSLDNKIHTALSPVKVVSPPYLSFHHPSISEQL